MQINVFYTTFSMIFGIAFIILLLLITLQDFKQFKVSFIFFPVCFILASMLALLHKDIEDYFGGMLQNIIFLFLLYFSLWLWFFLKAFKRVKIIDNLIGCGDILFFVVLLPVFSLEYYVLFLTVSFGSALFYSCIIFVRYREFRKIPLAGIMAGKLSLLLLFTIF